MNVDTQLMEYLYSRYDKQSIIEILKRNSLYGQLGGLFVKFDEDDLRVLKKKRADVRLLEKKLVKICASMEENDISYCTFKGVTLGRLLYGNSNCRQMNDIDIYVPQYDFDKAFEILRSNGFELNKDEGEKDEHHVVLTDYQIIIELHRRIFTPIISIDESYLHDNMIWFELFGCKLRTFSLTATLLHMIYHLYMDTCIVCQDFYSILVRHKIPQAQRFIYRAYELALFIEKYSCSICWREIECDLRSQKFRIIFMKMILDIQNIFPNIFPECILQTVRMLDYIDDETDQPYKYLVEMEAKEKGKNVEYFLCEYIDKNWNARKVFNINKSVGESIILSEGDMGKDNRNCRVDSERIVGGIKLSFIVPKIGCYFSELGNYDTQESDGVHLLLCGTKKFSYNSIFFFPKIINGTIKVISCNVLNNVNVVLDETLIKATFFKTESGYVLEVILRTEFIVNNSLESFFYMGVVLPDCSSETRHRRGQLILSEDDSQWYNPIFFAKIMI